jgi:hypothetical protein
MPLCLGAPIAIEPGETIDLQYGIVAGPPGTRIAPQFKVSSIDGLYRMVWNVYQELRPDGTLGELLPFERRVSNSFTISMAP